LKYLLAIKVISVFVWMDALPADTLHTCEREWRSEPTVQTEREKEKDVERAGGYLQERTSGWMGSQL
jgi:hypothetical protein